MSDFFVRLVAADLSSTGGSICLSLAAINLMDGCIQRTYVCICSFEDKKFFRVSALWCRNSVCPVGFAATSCCRKETETTNLRIRGHLRSSTLVAGMPGVPLNEIMCPRRAISLDISRMMPYIRCTFASPPLASFGWNAFNGRGTTGAD